jgi:hypothetical protein
MGRDVIQRDRKPRAPRSPRDLEPIMNATRENMVVWMKQRIEEIRIATDERIEALRNGGEHPSPIFQKMVHQYALMGLEEKYIAKMLFISHQQLIRYYEEDIKLGYAEGIVTMGTTLYAIGSDPTHKDAAKVALEWLSRRGGEEWKPPTNRVEAEIKNKDERRIINSDELTREQRDQLRDMINQHIAAVPELPPPVVEEPETEDDEEVAPE